MRTRKPISTISFNTKNFLINKLDELYESKIIQFYSVVFHLPEDDEAGKKDHYHVYIEPAKLVDTCLLRDEFKEFDPEKPGKPLGVLIFNNSTFPDWYLYGIHDPAYLATKGQSRRYHYSFNDMIVPDQSDLLYKVKMIDMLKLTPYRKMIEAQQNGLSWNEFFKLSSVPIQQLGLYERAWYLLKDSYTERNGSPGHAMELPDEDLDQYDHISLDDIEEVFGNGISLDYFLDQVDMLEN